MAEAFTIAGRTIEPGTRAIIEFPVGRLYTHAELTMPIQVVVGPRSGPRLFLSAAVHGDEVNGVEIIRRILKLPQLQRLRGVLIAIPVVNVHGFFSGSRYFPDRRDLNRVFPGSPSGSLGARVANLFMETIVAHCTHGIDLHTGSFHRRNLPQVRATLSDPETVRLAKAFGAPVVLNADVPDGSLRQAVMARGIPMLLYEGGEPLRFDEISIRAGVKGIISVMRAIRMLPRLKSKRLALEPFIARSTSWVRAPHAGILRVHTKLGTRVDRGDLLAFLGDPFGENEIEVRSHVSGVVIGRTNLPLVNEGDALFKVARFKKPKSVARRVQAFHSQLEPDEDESGEEPPIV